MAKRVSGARQPLSQQKPGRLAKNRAVALSASQLAAARKQTKRGAPPAGKMVRVGSAQGVVGTAKASKKRLPEKRIAPPDPQAVWTHLSALYPDAHCELDFGSPWELLVATILSAQCTDKRVNMVTPALFARYPGPRELAEAMPEAVEAIIKSTGFFRAKTKSIIGAANAIVERHGGQVPSSMDDLVVLPGVGRKTANVVLGNAFDTNVGVVVDTHVSRLAARLGLSVETDPVRIERDLMVLFPAERWTLLSHLLIWHGRRVCDARRPRCGECPLHQICPSSLVRS